MAILPSTKSCRACSLDVPLGAPFTAVRNLSTARMTAGSVKLYWPFLKRLAPSPVTHVPISTKTFGCSLVGAP